MSSKPLRWLHGEVKTPPMSLSARREMGLLLRELQDGVALGLPHARPMPSIGVRCHELRVTDENRQWRLLYRLDPDAIIILDVFGKTTPRTPQALLATCRQRLKMYDGNRP